MESRYFVIRCPFDLHLRFERGRTGEPTLRNVLGDASPIRPHILDQLIFITPEQEWRYADRPTIQVGLPYVLLADEPVTMTVLDAFMDYRENPLPGTHFGGRFPIDVWPRNLMWAFEWRDISKDIILKRGDPWFYLHFEYEISNRSVNLFEAENTAEFSKFFSEINGAVNYVGNTFSLMSRAKNRRPRKLLQKKKL